MASLLLMLISKPSNRTIYAKEGFVIVATVWLSLSVIGALPFYISGQIPSYIDAFFETVSGFTTTGSSILTDVESLSKCMLFAIIFLVLSCETGETFTLETNISATAACFNNIGPGLAGVGLMSSYAAYSDISKFVLSIAMLLGRLEIYPILIAFSPSTWSKK